MRCIRCNTDNNLRDRTENQGRCKQCRHSFVFEPTSMGTVKMTDPMFAKAIADLSANDTLFFTEKQFLYLLEKRLKSKMHLPTTVFLVIFVFLNLWATLSFGGFLAAIFDGSTIPAIIVSIIINSIFITVVFRSTTSSQRTYQSRKQSATDLRKMGRIILAAGIVASLFIFKSYFAFVAYVVLGMLALYLGKRQLSKQSEVAQSFIVERADFQQWLVKWKRINPIDKLLISPRQALSPANVSPDVTAYSFDRLIVCDRADMAQFLIANNFHFEHNCAILSITGYPQNIFDTTIQMLRRNPDLQVYTFHDCTPQGLTLVHQLQTNPRWFQNSNLTIVDLGLLPRQILATETMFVQKSTDYAEAAQQLAPEVKQFLSASELAWLEAGNFVELESFPPKRLLQILHRAITENRTLEGDGGGLILVGDSISSYYTVDSFG